MVTTNAIASPLRTGSVEKRANTNSVGGTFEDEKATPAPRPASPVYIGSVPFLGDVVEGARPAAFSYLTPVDIPHVGSVYIVVARGDSQENQFWWSDLQQFSDVLLVPRCAAIGRSGFLTLVVRGEQFKIFQDKHMSIFTATKMKCLSGETMPLWCRHATKEDAIGLATSALVLYLQHRFEFQLGSDDRRIIHQHEIENTSSRHKIAVCARGTSSAAILAQECERRGISCSVGAATVQGRTDCLLVDVAPPVKDRAALLTLLGLKFLIARNGKRPVYVLHDDIAVVSSSHFDDSGAMMNNCRVLFTGATQHYLRHVLSDTNRITQGSVTLSLPVPMEPNKDNAALANVPNVSAPPQ